MHERDNVPKSGETFIHLVHLAQQHGPMIEEDIGEQIDRPAEYLSAPVFEQTALSQHNVALSIMANPDAIVLDEGLIKDMTEDDYSYQSFHSASRGFNKNILEKIRHSFPTGFPQTFSALNEQQKNWLVSRGAPVVLFSLKILNTIYKTDTQEEIVKLMQLLRSKNYFNLPFYRRIIYKLFSLDPVLTDAELKFAILERRETSALKHALKAVLKSGKSNAVVLLVYGLAHKLGEAVQSLGPSTNIIYEGRINTLQLDDYQKYISKTADKVLPCGFKIIPAKSSILKEDLIQILRLYRRQFLSTSIFTSGYQSKVMRNLVKLIEQADTPNQKFTYFCILKLLSSIDLQRAALFRDGQLPNNKNIFTATDKVILELRRAFDHDVDSLKLQMRESKDKSKTAKPQN